MRNEQMELSLAEAAAAAAAANRCPRGGRRDRRFNRANWWFNQMRQVVEHAIDWEPAPRFQPEQIWLPENIRRGHE